MAEYQIKGFRGGRVLTESASLLRRNIGTFGVLLLSVTVPANLMISYVSVPLLVGDGKLAGDGPITTTTLDQLPISSLFGLPIMITLGVLIAHASVSAALAFGVVGDLRGRNTRIQDCVMQALPRALTIVGILLLTIVLIMAPAFGLLLFMRILNASGGVAIFLVVGGGGAVGAMIYSAIWIASPVAMIERKGVTASLGRSAELTKGFRFRVFILILSTAGLSQLSEWLTPRVFDALQVSQFTWPGVAFWILERTALVGWEAVVVAVAYCHLRTLRDPWQPEEVMAASD